MLNDLYKETEDRMEKAIGALMGELNTIRFFSRCRMALRLM